MFDPSAPHIIILLVVVVLLFGATRMPRAAKSLGQSMHIFKKEVQGLSSDEPATPPTAAAAVSGPAVTALSAAPDPTQQQLADLQRQLADLQQKSAASNGQPAQTQQPL